MLTVILSIFSLVFAMVAVIGIFGGDIMNKKLFMLMLTFGMVGTILLYLFFGQIIEPMIFIYFLVMPMICLYQKHKDIYKAVLFPILALIKLIVGLSFFTRVVMFNSFPDYLTNYDLGSWQILIYKTLPGSLFSMVLAGFLQSGLRKWPKVLVMMQKYKIPFLVMASFLLVVCYYFIFGVIIGGLTLLNNDSLIPNITFTVAIFWVIYHLHGKNLRIESEVIQREQLRAYTEELEFQYEELHKVRHDYTNILLSMSGYITENNMDGLADYFNEKISPFEEQMRIKINQLAILKKIKIPEVKGIIANKIIRAQGAGIALKLEVADEINTLDMNMLSLCRSLGIIMDNAIEAASRCENPELEIALIKLETTALIIVKNNYAETPPSIEEIFQNKFSTKGVGRGYGLAILRELVDKEEDVCLSTYIKGQYFVQELEMKM